jgi:hypothetical protein
VIVFLHTRYPLGKENGQGIYACDEFTEGSPDFEHRTQNHQSNHQNP